MVKQMKTVLTITMIHGARTMVLRECNESHCVRPRALDMTQVVFADKPFGPPKGSQVPVQ